MDGTVAVARRVGGFTRTAEVEVAMIMEVVADTPGVSAIMSMIIAVEVPAGTGPEMSGAM